MEDINKFKPYIAHLDHQLEELKPLLESLNAKSLDEQLLLLNDERKRLDLTNKYAYLLSSLMFAHMKVLNYKDMSPVMGELARVKKYMDSAKQLDSNEEDKTHNKNEEQSRAKQIMNKALTPSISQANFQGKHTKFESNESDKDSSDESNGKEHKKDKADVDTATKKKNLPGRTKSKSKNATSKSKSQNDKSNKSGSASSTKTGKSNRVSKPKGKIGKTSR